MHPDAAQVLRERGAYPGQFESRLLTPPILAQPDLILTATREQRAACVRMVPGAVRHTFTVRQFGRLATSFGPLCARHPAQPAAGPGATTVWATATVTADSPARRLQALLDEVAAAGRPQLIEDDDLTDPVRRSIDAFRLCADEIQRALDALIAVIAVR
jgi:protein-tyrosine phosphatase